MSTTWMTPLLWFTSAIVMTDLSPLASMISSLRPSWTTVRGSPSTVVKVALPPPRLHLGHEVRG